MSEKDELDIFAGVEYSESESVFDLYFNRDVVSVDFAEYIFRATREVDENGSLNDLSSFLQSARDKSDMLEGIVSQLVHNTLTTYDDCPIHERLSEVSRILAEDKLLRKNVYRQALGLELIKSSLEDMEEIVRSHKDGNRQTLEELYDQIMEFHWAEMEPDFPAFFLSLVTGDVDYWEFIEDVDEDDEEGNGWS